MSFPRCYLSLPPPPFFSLIHKKWGTWVDYIWVIKWKFVPILKLACDKKVVVCLPIGIRFFYPLFFFFFKSFIYLFYTRFFFFEFFFFLFASLYWGRGKINFLPLWEFSPLSQQEWTYHKPRGGGETFYS